MSNPALAMFQAAIGQSFKDSPSPVGRFFAGTLLEAEEGRLLMEVTVGEHMTNPAQVLHGGAAAMLLDELIGAAVFTLGRPTLFTSVNLSVDFLSAAFIGDDLVAEAKPTRQGKTVVNMEGWVKKKEDGKLVAHATSNMLDTGRPHPMMQG